MDISFDKIEDSAKKLLLGKKIVDVRYMTHKETHDMMWSHRGIVIMLDDGTDFIPQCDEEGNDAGCLNFSNGQIVPKL